MAIDQEIPSEADGDDRDRDFGASLRRKMSDHIAWALLFYTGLQIFVTVGELKAINHTLLPYFALICLVAVIIPACKWLESRWDRLSRTAPNSPDTARMFLRDRVLLWIAAIGLPLMIAGAARLIAA